jgi:hypothetical protein
MISFCNKSLKLMEIEYPPITVLRETKMFSLITDTSENLTRQKHPKL